MVAYFGYLVLAGIQIPLFYKKDHLKRRYFNNQGYLRLCCIELICLASIRGYTVGADLSQYYLKAIDYYGRLPVSELLTAELVWPFDFEIGYFALTKLSVLLGLGKTGFLFVVAILIYIPLFRTIKKYSPMPYISILCYFAFGFFSYSLGILRQMIASSILFCGWSYIEDRRFFKYLLTVAIAMTFHTTAIVGILLYFLYGVNWRKVIGWIIPLEIVLLLFGRVFALAIVKIFPVYAGYVGSRYDTQGGTYLMLILLNVVLMACVLLRGKEKKSCESVTICALILAICVQCVGYSMNVLGRATRHFSVYLIFAIPYVLCNLKKKIGYRWTFVVTSLVVICLFVLSYLEFNGNKYIVPYYTIFD